jgi:hypothetical protein
MDGYSLRNGTKMTDYDYPIPPRENYLWLLRNEDSQYLCHDHIYTNGFFFEPLMQFLGHLEYLRKKERMNKSHRMAKMVAATKTPFNPHRMSTGAKKMGDRN